MEPAFLEYLEVYPYPVRPVLRDRALRKRVRYALSRLQTEAVEGVPAEDDNHHIPEGFREFFEAQDDWFDGWENWGVTWDVGDDEDFLRVVPRWLSLEEEWDEVIRGELMSNEIAARKRRRKQNGREGDV